jgi:hypothetical protein
VGLYFGRALEIGSWRTPGPGAFPLFLSAAALLYGAVVALRAVWRPADATVSAPRSPSRLALAALGVALIMAAVAFVRPASPYFSALGPAAAVAWYALVLATGALAAALFAGATTALGAVLVGLLLGMSSLDPLVPTVERYASLELGIGLTFAHGLALALVVHHIGLNGLLIALAVALATKLEKAARETLTSGGTSAFLDQPLSLVLLAAVLVTTVAVIWLRPGEAAAAPNGAGPPPLPAHETIWGGALAVLGGAVGLYFAPAGSDGVAERGTIGPGGAPAALAGALVVLGAVQLALAVWRRSPSERGEPPPLARAPATIGAIVLLAILGLLFIGVPIYVLIAGALPPGLTDFLLRYGPVEVAALIILLMMLCVAAAWLLPRGSLVRSLGAVVIGLLLGTIGLDSITGTIRYASVTEWEAAHGLAIGFVAYRIGFNPLLIAIGFVYSAMLEERLRQALLVASGDPLVFVEYPLSRGLLLAAAAVLVVAALLRWWQRRLA